MKIALALFTYNREIHTQSVVDAIKKNTMLPNKMFIFQDGCNNTADKDAWQHVNSIINNIDWCDKEVVVNIENKGLAQSIVDGVNYVFQNYDAIIVLEDDCVPHPYFIEYMISSLKKYENEKNVYAINGYAWIALDNKNANTHFSGRAGSWGWGQWKDRWQTYNQSYKLITEIKKDSEKVKQLTIWGEDLETYLIGNIKGTCNSWTVFWALQAIKSGSICLTPNLSLINNIGLDGSGVHCGLSEKKQFLREEDDLSEVRFPDDIKLIDNYERLYKRIFHIPNLEKKLQFYNLVLSKWIELRIDSEKINRFFFENNINSFYFWGKNNVSDYISRDISEDITFNGYIETQPNKKKYGNYNVITYNDIPDDVQCIIFIPAYEYDLVESLISEKIQKKIILLDDFIEKVGNYIDR